MLSTASWQALSWEDFCKTVKSVGGSSSGGPSSGYCKNTALGENYYGSNIYATLQMLSTYGLQGDISVKKNVMTASQIGGGGKPEMQWISLVKGCKQSEEGCFPAIPYCSVIPSDFAQLVDKLMNSSIACAPSMSARRGLKTSLLTERHPPSFVYSDILQRLNGLISITGSNRAASSGNMHGSLTSKEGDSMFRAGSLREVQLFVSTH